MVLSHPNHLLTLLALKIIPHPVRSLARMFPRQLRQAFVFQPICLLVLAQQAAQRQILSLAAIAGAAKQNAVVYVIFAAVRARRDVIQLHELSFQFAAAAGADDIAVAALGMLQYFHHLTMRQLLPRFHCPSYLQFKAGRRQFIVVRASWGLGLVVDLGQSDMVIVVRTQDCVARKALLYHIKRAVPDVHAHPLSFQALGRDGRRGAAAERVEHDFAFIAAGENYTLVQG